MAHVIRGTGTMNVKIQSRLQAPVQGNTGMVVGAVVNKPNQQSTSSAQHYGISVNPAAVMAGNQPNAQTNSIGMQAGQLPAGMLSVKSEFNGSSGQTGALKSQNLSVDLTNIKEKTPMCLVNELARYNKIQHQYTLTDETGPAHNKVFYVKLKLGDEEYSANGPSIKKAQHAAAEIALVHSKHKRPPNKQPKGDREGGGQYSGFMRGHNYMGPPDAANNSITPTVELNALAMRRGEPAMYRPVDMPRPQQNYYNPNLPPPPYNPRFSYPKFSRLFFVSLKVGQREFIGEGSTRQAARHNAAEKALKILRALPLPEKLPDEGVSETSAGEEKVLLGDPGEEGIKSEISLVHEIALKHHLNVKFEVIREAGPPHMRNFVTRCCCGEMEVDGEGNSKKLSKKRAAEKMLEKLQGLPALPSSIVKSKKTIQKKKNRNLIKIQKNAPEYGTGINPISRLIQIQQAKKEKEPVYSLVTERGLPRRREFVIQVSVGEQTCNGVGPNKKLAKRNAAEAMLQLLGYSRPSPQPGKPAIKSEGTTSPVDKKVTFIDQETSQTRQLVPGVLVMPEANRHQAPASGHVPMGTYGQQQHHHHHQPQHQQHPQQQPQHLHHDRRRGGGGQQQMGNTQQQQGAMFSTQTTAAIAKELLDTGSSPTAESLHKPHPGSGDGQQVRPKQQLLYLADVLGFTVQFTDFPKGNKTEYLSLVSLSTSPPQVSHGAGLTIEASHDMAALTALRSLSEMGLDKIKQEVPVSRMAGAGDGNRMKVTKGARM